MSKQADATPLAQQLACMLSRWVLHLQAPDFPPDSAPDIVRTWCPETPLELARLPDAERTLAAATQELLCLLSQFPEGRQALADFGFQPLLENVKRP